MYSNIVSYVRCGLKGPSYFADMRSVQYGRYQWCFDNHCTHVLRSISIPILLHHLQILACDDHYITSALRVFCVCVLFTLPACWYSATTYSSVDINTSVLNDHVMSSVSCLQVRWFCVWSYCVHLALRKSCTNWTPRCLVGSNVRLMTVTTGTHCYIIIDHVTMCT